MSSHLGIYRWASWVALEMEGELTLKGSCVWAPNFCSSVRGIVQCEVHGNVWAQTPALLLTSCMAVVKRFNCSMLPLLFMVYRTGRSRYIFHVKQNYYWNLISTHYSNNTFYDSSYYYHIDRWSASLKYVLPRGLARQESWSLAV